MDFSTLRDEFFRLYGDQKYLAAFDLADEFVSASPGEQTTVTNWKLCAASMGGKPDKVLSVFQKAINTGFFFSPGALRGDPDLAAMQDNSEYQRLVGICEQRFQQARETTKPALFTSLPKTGTDGPYPLLMAFHGWGQSIDDFSPHWDSLAEKGWLVALPRSSQVVGNGVHVWDNLDLFIREAAEHYQALNREYKIDPKRIVLAGFSQGGGGAFWMGLTQVIPACGVVGVGPYLNTIESLAPSLPKEPVPNFRMYLISGTKENDEGMFAKIGALCSERNVLFHHEIVPGIGHEFPPDFGAMLQSALAFIFDEKKD